MPTRGVSATWVWNGSTWTQQHPATSPPAQNGAPMAYDAATGNVVLFVLTNGNLGDTWVWDGSTWLGSTPPPARPLGRVQCWPTTRSPATWSCSAGKPPLAFSLTPGSGTLTN
jgi:hypothetical protein